jgi:NAD(P)H-quinone oxidoreductase subunit 6
MLPVSLENWSQIFLFGMEFIVVVSALGVVLIPNIVYSAFFLAIVLMTLSGFYVVLNAEFLAAAQILIYIGAINVLILFAIMLVNNRLAVQTKAKSLLARFFAGLLSLGCFVIVTFMIFQTSWPKPPFVAQSESFYIISNHLFSDSLLSFEIISLILLIALIGAVVLARKEKLAQGKESSPIG